MPVTPSTPTNGASWRRKLWLGLHAIIILNFVIQMAYAAYMIFVVFAPTDVSGPLYAAARDLPFEWMVTRRLYAIEFWLATVGLSVYLAITEIAPRLRQTSKG